MKRYLTAILVLSVGIFTMHNALAEEPMGARMIVMIDGSDIASNQILYQYMDLVDLNALISLANAHETKAVPFGDLISQLPEPMSGWTGDKPDGMLLNMGTFAYSFGSRDYTKDGAEDDVTVMLWDTVGEQMGPWFAFWYGAMSIETTEGFIKHGTYKGYNSVEQRTYADNSGNLIVGLSMAPMPEIGSIVVLSGLLSLVYVFGKRVAAQVGE